MTISEKVGQLLIGYFNGSEVNHEAETLIKEVHIGGFVYYNWANGLTSPDQTKKLSASLQKLSQIPLFIACDQEGGVVQRLKNGFTHFPGNRALGRIDPQFAEDAAYSMGVEMASVGINLNFAPVVDINTEKDNPVIGIRSFGQTAEKVTVYAERALLGFHKAGVLTTLKHYPGHGATKTDSHYDLPVLMKTKRDLEEVELKPFQKLSCQTDAIMTGHILLPHIDPDNCATLSKPILDYLREVIGFKGLVISDCLAMEGLKKNALSLEEGAIRAFQAGCDILLFGGGQLTNADNDPKRNVENLKRIHGGLVKAVTSGRISEKRIDESLMRIFLAKGKFSSPPPFTLHKKLSKEIALNALKVYQNGSFPFDEKTKIVAPSFMKDALLMTDFSSRPLLFIDEEISSQIQESSSLVLISHQNNQKELYQKLIKIKPCAVICARDPSDRKFFSDAPLIITTASPAPASLQAAYEPFSKNKR